MNLKKLGLTLIGMAIVLVFILVFILVFALFFRSKPINVGVLLPFSGQYGWLGQNVLTSVEVVVDEINKNGGIVGRNIKLITADTKADPKTAILKLNELIDEKVVAIIGPSSFSFAGVKKILEDKKIPMISPLAGTNELDKASKNLFHRTVPSDSMGGQVIAKAISDPKNFMGIETEFENIFVIIGKHPAYVSFKESILNAFNDFGGNLKGALDLDLGKESYENEVKNILEQSADMIVLLTPPTDAKIIINEAQAKGYTGHWFVNQDELNEEFASSFNDDVAKKIFGLEEAILDNELLEKFSGKLKSFKKGEDIKVFSASSYDAANILFLAILRAKLKDDKINNLTVARNIRQVTNGGENKIKVKDFFEGEKSLEVGKEIDYVGFSNINFDEYGNVSYPFFIKQIKNGKFETVSSVGQEALNKVTKVAAVFMTPVAETWNNCIHKALLRAKKELKVVYNYSDNVASLEQALRDYASKGYDLVFADAFKNEELVNKIAKEFPNTKFVFGSVNMNLIEPNVAIFNSWLFEPSYLMGLMAGKLTKRNVVGVVAGYSEPITNRAINAFISGIKEVNKKAKVKVEFINSWYDTKKTNIAAQKLMKYKADVVFAERDGVIESLKGQKIILFGNMDDKNNLAPKKVVTSAVWDMWPVVHQIIMFVKDGAFVSKDYADFSTIAKKGAYLAPFHGYKLSRKLENLIAKKKKDIIDGKFKVVVSDKKPVSK